MKKVLRIRGVNFLVEDVRAVADFYQEVLGLRPRHLGEREGFLHWDLRREDFVGLFRRRDWPDFPDGWHHVELRMEASSYEEAVQDVKAKGLEQCPGPWGVAATSDNLEQARRDFPGLPVDPPLIPLSLYFNAQDSEGRNLELVYFENPYSRMEIPGLLEVRLAAASEKLETLRHFYERLGMGMGMAGRTGQISFQLSSGQVWTLQPSPDGCECGGLHSVVVGADEPYLSRVVQALRAREHRYKVERGIAFHDPEGYRWEIWKV